MRREPFGEMPERRFDQRDPRWVRGPRVKVRDMKHGARFVTIYGEVVTRLGEHGSHAGCFHVEAEGGADMIAGNAEGVLLPE